MKKIGFIDISNTNCWMIYLMPFDKGDRTDYARVLELQMECIKKGIFGMGWDIPCFTPGTPMTDENARIYEEKYQSVYKDEGGSVSKDAISGYRRIKKGDYVITRLKNGHYYVGRVSSAGAIYIYRENDPVYGMFSWGGTVEKWIEYANDQELPAEIVGRFSQRMHATIQRIAPYRQKFLVISMYEKKMESPVFDIPRLHIGLGNFVRSLTYMELEDLVALLITRNHTREGYKLIPSSCKISQQNYEFSYFAKGRKPITCQVKNQKAIDLDDYIHETSYEKIYIFSGVWDESAVSKLRDEYSAFNHIYIVAPSELYSILKEEQFLSNDFYDYETTPLSVDEINLDDYTKLKNPKGEKTYSVDEKHEFICFINGDGLFYSEEFESLVLSWDVFDGTEYDKSSIQRVLEDISNSIRDSGFGDTNRM